MTSDVKGVTLLPTEGKKTGHDGRNVPQIELKNVSKYYHYSFGDVIALNSVSMSIDGGEFIAIVGPKGSGKTTLINIIGCIDNPTSGSVKILENDLIDLGEKELDRFRIENISLVSPLLRLNPKKSIRQILQDRLVFKTHTKSTGVQAENAMERAAIPQLYWETPTEELNEEMLLRGSIARALVTDPKILVLDEPLKKFDLSIIGDILMLLKRLHDQGMTVIIATEDPNIARRTMRQIWLHEGSLMEDKRVTKAGHFISDELDLRRNEVMYHHKNDKKFVQIKRNFSMYD